MGVPWDGKVQRKFLLCSANFCHSVKDASMCVTRDDPGRKDLKDTWSVYLVQGRLSSKFEVKQLSSRACAGGFVRQRSERRLLLRSEVLHGQAHFHPNSLFVDGWTSSMAMAKTRVSTSRHRAFCSHARPLRILLISLSLCFSLEALGCLCQQSVA